jgi:hypothetical protein
VAAAVYISARKDGYVYTILLSAADKHWTSSRDLNRGLMITLQTI